MFKKFQFNSHHQKSVNAPILILTLRFTVSPVLNYLCLNTKKTIRPRRITTTQPIILCFQTQLNSNCSKLFRFQSGNKGSNGFIDVCQ